MTTTNTYNLVLRSDNLKYKKKKKKNLNGLKRINGRADLMLDSALSKTINRLINWRKWLSQWEDAIKIKIVLSWKITLASQSQNLRRNWSMKMMWVFRWLVVLTTYCLHKIPETKLWITKASHLKNHLVKKIGTIPKVVSKKKETNKVLCQITWTW